MLKTRWRFFIWAALGLLALSGAAYGLIRAGYLPTPEFMMKQPAPLPAPAATRDERMRQAVEYLGSQLPYLHVNPYFKISEADFQRSAARLAEQVPNLNDEQIMVELLRIVASLGDGHTRAFPGAEPVSFASLPLEMRWLEDGLIVTAAAPEYEQALGAKVVQIGAHPVQEVYEAVKPLVSGDNEVELMSGTPALMAMPAILYGLDLIAYKDAATFGFEAQDGSSFSLELRPASDSLKPLVTIYEKSGLPRPLAEQDRRSFYWYRHLPEVEAVYVQYNVCAEQEGKPFQAFVDEVFRLIDRQQVKRLVLDVRYNGGGNEAVLGPFIEAVKARPALTTAGNFFVIIGRETFSSALQNAITLSQEVGAILVGEATGGKPNHYGEVRRFRLPNLGLLVQYSTRYWLSYPESDPLTLEPDVPAAASIADLVAGRDPALEAALLP